MREEKNLIREEKLLQALNASDKISTEDAASLLGVSISTAHRVFIDLEKKGQVVKTYGGVKAVQPAQNEYSYDRLETVRVDIKQKLGNFAAGLLEDRDVVYLDNGTTVTHMAVCIASLIQSGKLNHISIFTNSLVNLNILSPIYPVNLIGGEYRPHRRDFCGYLAEETLKRLHFTKSFFSADAFDLKYGFTATDFDSSRLGELVIQNSDYKCAIVDSSKFGNRSVVSFAKVSDVSLIVTDSEVDPAIAAGVREMNKEIVII
jgi:DeoR/GlpR family transcriptional regulator of sugar metabolism